MKLKLVLSLVISIFHNHVFAQEHLPDPYIKLLKRSGFNDFLEDISRFQNIQNISEVDEIDYQVKFYFSSVQFWKDFESKKYEQILLNKLRTHFSYEDVVKILEQFERPFMQNIFKQLVFRFDYFEFLDVILDTNFKEKTDQNDIFLLYKNSFKLYGLSIQTDILSSELEIYADENKVDVNYFSLKQNEIRSINSNVMRKRINNIQEFFINYWAAHTPKISKSELREHTRIWNKNRIGQKFLQFAVNYHFLFLHSHFRNLEKTTK